MWRRPAILLGVAAYWLSWPLLFAYTGIVKTERTRVLLVSKSGKLLLVRVWYGRGEWTLPGGGLHKNEQPVYGAQRELMEETGIGLGVDQLARLGTDRFSKSGVSYMCHYFYAEPGKPLRTRAGLPEIIDIRWVPLAKLDDYRLGDDVHHALSAHNTLVQ